MKLNPQSGLVRWFAVLALLFVLGAARAGTDIFLRLEGIDGESKDQAHPRWMDIQSFHWGVTRPAGTNLTQMSALQLFKRVDSASPLLHLACANGQHFPKVTLDLVRPGERRVRYYRIVLEDVLVTSSGVAWTEPAAEYGVAEILGLAYGRMSWTYTEFAPDGKAARELAAYWDLLKGLGEATVKDATRVSGAPSPAGGGMELAFPASGGTTYRIMGSSDPFGPYVEVRRFTADTTGPAATTISTGSARQFFYLEEVP